MEIMAFVSRGGRQLAESKTKRTRSVTVTRPSPATSSSRGRVNEPSLVESAAGPQRHLGRPDRTSSSPAGSQPRAHLGLFRGNRVPDVRDGRLRLRTRFNSIFFSAQAAKSEIDLNHRSSIISATTRRGENNIKAPDWSPISLIKSSGKI